MIPNLTVAQYKLKKEELELQLLTYIKVISKEFEDFTGDKVEAFEVIKNNDGEFDNLKFLIDF